MCSTSYALFFMSFITMAVSQREEYDCKLKEGCHVQCDPAYGAKSEDRSDVGFPLHCRLRGEDQQEIPIKLFQDNKARLSDLSKKMMQLTENRMQWENLTKRIGAEMKKGREEIERQEQEILRLNEKITALSNADEKARIEIQNLNESLRAQNVKMKSLEVENRALWREIIKLKNDGVEPEKGPCELQDDTRCYWIHIKAAWEINLKDGESICRNGGGKVALIRNSTIYDGIVSRLKRQMPFGADNLYVWVAMTYDPILGVASPPDAFYSWRWSFPSNGETNRRSTKIYIQVYEFTLLNAKPEDQTGMINGASDWLLNGVVCERENS